MFASLFRAIVSRHGDLRRFSALIAAIIPALCCSGCVGFLDAELNNRGGYIDAKLDERWLIADTKQMRVLRAYILIGSLARMPQEQYSKTQREIIIAQIGTSVHAANEAFICAYDPPGHCVYFDERMAELEVAVLRLAVAVFTSEENETLFKVVNDQVSAAIPLFKGLDSISKLFDAFTSSAELAASTGKIISSLLKIGQTGYYYGRRIGALYRDSIELHMVAVLASLQYQCKWLNSTSYFQATGGTDTVRAARQFYGVLRGELDPCTTYNQGFLIWERGAGDFSAWVEFLYGDAATFRTSIIPDQNAFIQASDLIWRACEQITDDPEQIAKCLGRRPKNDECGCTAQSDGADNCNMLMYGRVAKAKRKHIDVSSATGEYCPLIAFAEAWDRRNDRYSGASARMDYLSEPNIYFREPAIH